MSKSARLNRPIEAEIARIFLESHGVDAVVFDTRGSNYADGGDRATAVRLMVLDEDLSQIARQLLETQTEP